MKKSLINSVVTLLVTGTVAATVLCGCDSVGEIDPFDYIELGEYKGLDIKKQVHEVTEAEIQDEINTLAGAYAVEETIDSGKVESGDIANIDYEGKLDGVAFDGGTAQGYDLSIGSGTFINGFEDGLIGVEVGDTVDLNLTFPENYQMSDLAGQDVVFTVKVNHITRSTLPEVTDEFIKDVSKGQFESLDVYKEALTEQIISEYEEYNKLQYYEDLWNAAVDNATVIKDIPADLISEKTSKMVVNAQQYATSYGLPFSDFVEQYMGMTTDEFNKSAAEYANNAAKESLVLKAIAKKEGISVTKEELEEAVAEYTELGGYSSVEEFKELNNMDDLEEYILLSKVEDFLASQATGN